MNACDEYASSHAAVLAALEEIREHIENLPAPDALRTRWDEAGSMAHVQDQLAGILAFLGIGNE